MTNATRHTANPARPSLSDAVNQREIALREMESISTVVRLRRGDGLDVGSDQAKLVFVVRSGYLILQTNIQSNQPVALSLYGPGSILRASDLPAFGACSAIATLPCHVLRTTDLALERLMTETPAVHTYCRTQQGLQCARDKAHIVLLSRFSSEQRLASLFVEMAQQIGQRHGRGVVIEIPLARRDIAQLLALNPDTLSRVLSRLKSAGLLKSSGRRGIQITDLPALTALIPGNGAALDAAAPKAFL